MTIKSIFNQFFNAAFPKRNKQNFEKVLFHDRLVHYDEQMQFEYNLIKGSEWFRTEPLEDNQPYQITPLHLKASNREVIDEKLNQWKQLRKKANLSSKKLIKGIELLLEYGVWTDPITIFLDEILKNEGIVYTTDDSLILSTLLENSCRVVRNEDEEMFESYIVFDFEKYFEENLSLPLKTAGFLDIKLSQSVQKYDESLLRYHFVIEFGNQKRFITMTSDGDLFLLIRFIFNGILIESGSNMRFYRMQFCPYPILLEKELALELMKKYEILIFNEGWGF